MRPSPLVSVIIVNYNGAHFLPTCLDAVLRQSYPSERYKVVVCDNGSSDGSVELIETQYPAVEILEYSRNLGFATGNNAGIQASRGEYVVLLNNDTVADPEWLASLVAVADHDPRAGMVTGRLLLFRDQLPVEILADAFQTEPGSATLGVQVFQADCEVPGGVYQYLEGFHGWENCQDGLRCRWSAERALMGVPVPPGGDGWMLRMRLAAPRPDGRDVRVRASVGGTKIAEWRLSGAQPVDCQAALPASARELAKPLVQNAGALIFRDGSGRDRGTWVRDCEVLYETDEGQYDQAEEVFAGCGASLLIRREMLDEVGLLDDDFFMYYEDIDLAWRARLRRWRVFYAPQALVRHVHCGSSGEWSPLFSYLVDRNRLAMVFKNGSPAQIVRAWAKYGGEAVANAMRLAVSPVVRDIGWRATARRAFLQWRVIARLAVWLPGLWRKRWLIQRSRLAASDEIDVWFVD